MFHDRKATGVARVFWGHLRLPCPRLPRKMQTVGCFAGLPHLAFVSSRWSSGGGGGGGMQPGSARFDVTAAPAEASPEGGEGAGTNMLLFFGDVSSFGMVHLLGGAQRTV